MSSRQASWIEDLSDDSEGDRKYRARQVKRTVSGHQPSDSPRRSARPLSQKGRASAYYSSDDSQDDVENIQYSQRNTGNREQRVNQDTQSSPSIENITVKQPSRANVQRSLKGYRSRNFEPNIAASQVQAGIGINISQSFIPRGLNSSQSSEQRQDQLAGDSKIAFGGGTKTGPGGGHAGGGVQNSSDSWKSGRSESNPWSTAPKKFLDEKEGKAEDSGQQQAIRRGGFQPKGSRGIMRLSPDGSHSNKASSKSEGTSVEQYHDHRLKQQGAPAAAAGAKMKGNTTARHGNGSSRRGGSARHHNGDDDDDDASQESSNTVEAFGDIASEGKVLVADEVDFHRLSPNAGAAALDGFSSDHPYGTSASASATTSAAGGALNGSIGPRITGSLLGDSHDLPLSLPAMGAGSSGAGSSGGGGGGGGGSGAGLIDDDLPRLKTAMWDAVGGESSNTAQIRGGKHPPNAAYDMLRKPHQSLAVPNVSKRRTNSGRGASDDRGYNHGRTRADGADGADYDDDDDGDNHDDRRPPSSKTSSSKGGGWIIEESASDNTVGGGQGVPTPEELLRRRQGQRAGSSRQNLPPEKTIKARNAQFKSRSSGSGNGRFCDGDGDDGFDDSDVASIEAGNGTRGGRGGTERQPPPLVDNRPPPSFSSLDEGDRADLATGDGYNQSLTQSYTAGSNPMLLQRSTDSLSRFSFAQIAHAHGRRTEHVQCTVVRERHSSFQDKLYPSYTLILEDTNKTLIIAKKMNMNRTSNYHLFDMTRGQLSTKLSKKSGNYLGKLRAKNMNRTDYVLLNQNSEKEEIAGVRFDRLTLINQLKEGNQPRKMKVMVPPVDENGVPIPNRTQDGDRGSLADKLNQFESAKLMGKRFNLLVFESKDPVFENGNYRLNFNGRVSMPSVKNFQMVSADNIDDVVCQFGKVEEDIFHLDFKAPLNACQAFAFALCQFNL